MKFREKKIFFLSAKTPKNKTKPINTKKTKQQKHTASFEGMLKKKMEIRYEFDIKKNLEIKPKDLLKIITVKVHKKEFKCIVKVF